MFEMQRCHDKEQWDDFILENGGHPLQLWGWGQVKAAHGWSVERVCAYYDDEMIGAAQILIRKLPYPFRAFAYIPRGPVTDEAHQAELLESIANLVQRDYRAVTVSVEPNSREFNNPDGWCGTRNSILKAETILLDLTQSESELLSHMAKKTRQYIRKSASEIEIKRVRSKEDLVECLRIYKQTAERAGFSIHEDQYYLDVFQQMGDFSPVFAAYVDEKPVAFLWLAISSDIAYELYGGMNDDGSRLRANYALKWYVIRKVKEWGLREYDFGGLVAGGVSTFKQGWTDQETLYAGTFDKPLSPYYTLWTSLLPRVKKAVQRIRLKRS